MARRRKVEQNPQSLVSETSPHRLFVLRQVMDTAFQMSTTLCKRKKTITLLGHGSFQLLSSTVNGPSLSHECTNEIGNCGCAHAEQLAIIKALRCRWKNLILLSTYSPCTNCANMIIASKIIQEVWWGILTEHDIRGHELLLKNGVPSQCFN